MEILLVPPGTPAEEIARQGIVIATLRDQNISVRCGDSSQLCIATPASEVGSLAQEIIRCYRKETRVENRIAARQNMPFRWHPRRIFGQLQLMGAA